MLKIQHWLRNKEEKAESLERLTLVFLRQRERLRYRETLKSLNAFRSSPKPSLGNFLRAYWYLWAASFIFPFWRTHGGQTCSEEEDRTRRKMWGERSRARYSPDTPTIALARARPSHQSHTHTQASWNNTHTHTLHLTSLSFLPQNSIC